MLTMSQTIAMCHVIPPEELPSSPDEIDLKRIVDDPDYRNAVKELLRQWYAEQSAAAPGSTDQEDNGA